MPLWIQRFLLAAGLLFAGGLVAWLGVTLARTRVEYARMVRIEAQTRQRLAELRLRLAEQEAILERLRNDPAYVETVIRRRLGYAKPGELVFRFED